MTSGQLRTRIRNFPKPRVHRKHSKQGLVPKWMAVMNQILSRALQSYDVPVERNFILNIYGYGTVLSTSRFVSWPRNAQHFKEPEGSLP